MSLGGSQSFSPLGYSIEPSSWKVGGLKVRSAIFSGASTGNVKAMAARSGLGSEGGMIGPVGPAGTGPPNSGVIIFFISASKCAFDRAILAGGSPVSWRNVHVSQGSTGGVRILFGHFGL